MVNTKKFVRGVFPDIEFTGRNVTCASVSYTDGIVTWKIIFLFDVFLASGKSEIVFIP